MAMLQRPVVKSSQRMDEGAAGAAFDSAADFDSVLPAAARAATVNKYGDGEQHVHGAGEAEGSVESIELDEDEGGDEGACDGAEHIREIQKAEGMFRGPGGHAADGGHGEEGKAVAPMHVHQGSRASDTQAPEAR